MKYVARLAFSTLLSLAFLAMFSSSTSAQFFEVNEPPPLLSPEPGGEEWNRTPTNQEIQDDPYCRIYCANAPKDPSCDVCFRAGTQNNLDTAAVNIGNPLGNPATGRDDSIPALQQRLGTLLGVMLRGIAALSLLPIVVGGFQMIISQGNEDKVSRGKSTLYFGVVGLVLALTGIAIFQTLLSFLVNAPKQ